MMISQRSILCLGLLAIATVALVAGKFGDRIRSPSASNEDSVTLSSAPLPVIPAPSPLTVTVPIRSQSSPIDTIRSQSSPIDTIRSQSVKASDFEDADDSSSYSDSGASSDGVVNENTDLAPTKASASEGSKNFGPTPNYVSPTVPSYGSPSIVRGDHGPPSGYIPNYFNLYNQHQANTPSYYQPSASAHSSHPSSASAHSENDLYPGAPAFMKDLLNAFETLRSQSVPQPTTGTHQMASNQQSGQQVASSRTGNLASPTASSSQTISNQPVAPSSFVNRNLNQDTQSIKSDRVGNNRPNEHAQSFGPNEYAQSFGPNENFDPFTFFTTNHKPIASADHAHPHYEGNGHHNHGPHSTHAHMDHNHDHNYHKLPSHAGPYYNPPPPPPAPPAPDFFKALVASNHQPKHKNGHAQNGNQKNQSNNRRNGENLYNQASNNLGHPSGYPGRSGHAQTHSHDHGHNHGHENSGNNHGGHGNSGHGNSGHGSSEHAYKLPDGLPDPAKDERAKMIKENVGSENSEGKPWGSKMQYVYRDPNQPNNYMEVTEVRMSMNRQYNNKDDANNGASGPNPGYPNPNPNPSPSSPSAASEERPHFNVPFPTMPVLPSLDPTSSSFYPGADPYFIDHDSFMDY